MQSDDDAMSSDSSASHTVEQHPRPDSLARQHLSLASLAGSLVQDCRPHALDSGVVLFLLSDSWQLASLNLSSGALRLHVDPVHAGALLAPSDLSVHPKRFSSSEWAGLPWTWSPVGGSCVCVAGERRLACPAPAAAVDTSSEVVCIAAHPRLPVAVAGTSRNTIEVIGDDGKPD